MFVCNREHYGYLPVPLGTKQTLEDEVESFTHTLTEAMSESPDGRWLYILTVQLQLRANVCTPSMFFSRKKVLGH